MYESLMKRYKAYYATQIGTLLHEYAKDRIDYSIRLNKSSKGDVLLYLLKNRIPREVIDIDYIYDNFMAYVNDGIGFRMDTEITLVYTRECLGHADTINYSNDKHILRIHDYKSGIAPAHIEQLKAYAALFYLEYMLKPEDNTTILRIYQTDNQIEETPEPEEIRNVMNTIISDVKGILNIKTGRL